MNNLTSKLLFADYRSMKLSCHCEKARGPLKGGSIVCRGAVSKETYLFPRPNVLK